MRTGTDLSGLRGREIVVTEKLDGENTTRREHPVPPEVLAARLRRFGPPYPGDAHRTWYVGASGTIEEEV